MSTKQRKMELIIRAYKDATGKSEVDMKEVAKYAVREMGWKLPEPKSPLDRLASDFSKAARDQIRYDPKTGRPYRANHSFIAMQGHQQLHLWFDIDEAPPRIKMVKSLIMRREQMIGDGLQLTLDADHWNSINPHEKPIQIPLDFTEDVEERKNAPYEKKAS